VAGQLVDEEVVGGEGVRRVEAELVVAGGQVVDVER